ncbi:MAG: sulfite exporter TauE/SafE family protein [Micavibrio aeruginosavorus]|uniref:Probable membrane transporter protein n=1 Tax=Micavibrio aeruginosavorus TaxID=349221 RepID=A0A7T5UI32_9BACT|nr:MAG: sulfite exporter TauE/SafE family protein [Micavibrio aeruginosavorus]
MEADILLYVAAGFLAQLVDGSLSMAYGLTASSLLLTSGLPAATVSATVHAAECFTTGASALSHRGFGNIDKSLFRKMVMPAVAGAIIGAYTLSALPVGTLRPLIAVYLALMGAIIIYKAWMDFPSKRVTGHLGPLGFFGALIDAIGGGGWGPIVASNLAARGHDIRTTVGTVIAVEFFVTIAASATFLLTMGLHHLDIILALAGGGVLAAPLGAYFVKKVPIKPFMVFVGLFIITLGTYNFLKAMNYI